MTNEEKNQKLLQIYAALGELSVLKKQTDQRLVAINTEIDKFEKNLVEVLKQEVVEPIIESDKD